MTPEWLQAMEGQLNGFVITVIRDFGHAWTEADETEAWREAVCRHLRSRRGMRRWWTRAWTEAEEIEARKEDAERELGWLQYVEHQFSEEKKAKVVFGRHWIFIVK